MPKAGAGLGLVTVTRLVESVAMVISGEDGLLRVVGSTLAAGQACGSSLSKIRADDKHRIPGGGD
jgi:hypothetical protein